MGWANTQWVEILATDVFLFSQYIYNSIEQKLYESMKFENKILGNFRDA